MRTKEEEGLLGVFLVLICTKRWIIVLIILRDGGHPIAAGLSIIEAKVEGFSKAFLNYVKVQIKENDLSPTLILDRELNLSDIDGRVMSFLDKLSPHGLMNMRQSFFIKNVQIKGVPKVLGSGGEYLKFSVKQNGRTYPAIAFNMFNCYE